MAVAAAVAVLVVSQQSGLSDKPLDRHTTQPVGVFSCLSPGGLSCKSVGCILDKKTGRLAMN